MTGSVRTRHILLPVKFRLLDDRAITLEFVVDTGFTGMLALPPEAVIAMGLPFLHRIPAQLADASFVEVAVHSARIMWNGMEVETSILATGERPLLGTALLDGCELFAQFWEYGKVTIVGL